MNAAKLILCLLTSTVTIGCNVDKSGQPFNFPSNQIGPAPSSGGGGGSTSIQIVSTATFNSVSNQPIAIGNLVYDGTRLMTIDTTGGWPISNNVSFDYFSTSLTYQTQSTTNYGGSVNNSISMPGPSAGQTSLYWSGNLSVRDNSNGNVLSTVAINFANYGCTTYATDESPVTYCNGLYYGACTTGGGLMRFFSFNAAGTMQSAITTNVNQSTYGRLNAVTCYGGNSLVLVTGISASANQPAFYKFDLNFSLLASDTSSSAQFPTGLTSIVGIATDGTNLFLQGAANSGANPETFMLGTATFGNLK